MTVSSGIARVPIMGRIMRYSRSTHPLYHAFYRSFHRRSTDSAASDKRLVSRRIGGKVDLICVFERGQSSMEASIGSSCSSKDFDDEFTLRVILFEGNERILWGKNVLLKMFENVWYGKSYVYFDILIMESCSFYRKKNCKLLFVF